MEWNPQAAQTVAAFPLSRLLGRNPQGNAKSIGRILIGFDAFLQAVFSASLSMEALVESKPPYREIPLTYIIVDREDLVDRLSVICPYLAAYPVLTERADGYLPLPQPPKVVCIKADVDTSEGVEEVVKAAKTLDCAVITDSPMHPYRRLRWILPDRLGAHAFIWSPEPTESAYAALCEELAIQRHALYLGGDKTEALAAFESLNSYKKMSSRYAVFSLPFKLALLKMRLARRESGGKQVDFQTFLSKYDPEQTLSCAYPYQDGVRTHFAAQEHARWNGFMMGQGYLPATLTDIREKERYGTDAAACIHANLTTFEGLKRFAELAAERTGQSAADTDVIKYDFQCMDSLYELLQDTDYVIKEFD